jgi:hypothetical protein
MTRPVTMDPRSFSVAHTPRMNGHAWVDETSDPTPDQGHPQALDVVEWWTGVTRAILHTQASSSRPLRGCFCVGLRTEAGDESQRQPFVSRGRCCMVSSKLVLV